MGSPQGLETLANLCSWFDTHGQVHLPSLFHLFQSINAYSWFIVPVTPPQTYLTLSLRNLGFTTTQTSLLSIPSLFLGMTLLLAMAFASEIINSRITATIVLQFWALPLLITLFTFNQKTSQWGYFAVVSLIAGYPYVHPIQVAWASRNSYSVRTRCVTSIAKHPQG